LILFLTTAFFEIFLETTGEIFKESEERQYILKNLVTIRLPLL
jgi:hypothetical protein